MKPDLEDLDADALAIAATECGMPAAAAARVIARYREMVETIEGEPEWKAVSHMHGPGWGASTYAAEGCQISMTQWSHGKGDSERVYGIPHRQKGYRTFREALAALNGRSFKGGPTRDTAGHALSPPESKGDAS